MAEKLRVLVVGCGHMGRSHARSYHRLEGFEIAGLVSRSDGSREKLLGQLGTSYPQYDDFATALERTRPDAVSINTYPDTHAAYAIQSMRAGAHVFLEKPMAETIADAEAVLRVAGETRRKLVVGYILHHHPAYAKLVEIGRTLGKPLVMRMNLNQQSFGPEWETHKNLMKSVSPLVDCGVHYVDIMCRVTGARPQRVHAVGARLSEEIDPGMYNYGHMQISFDDGSVGWYEAGWGPMMSKVAYFTKDLIGPKGSVSIVGGKGGDSSDLVNHTRMTTLLVHSAASDGDGKPARADRHEELPDEPSHQELCDREQAFFLRAVREDLDLEAHHRAAVDSLRIVLAADESFRTGKIVEL